MLERFVSWAWILVGIVLLGAYSRDVYFGLSGTTTGGILAASGAAVLLCIAVIASAIYSLRVNVQRAFTALSIAGACIAAGAVIFLLFEGGELGTVPLFFAATLVVLEALTLYIAAKQNLSRN